MTGLMEVDGDTSSSVQVAVRLRPLNDLESMSVTSTPSKNPRFRRKVQDTDGPTKTSSTTSGAAWTCTTSTNKENDFSSHHTNTLEQVGARRVVGKSVFTFDHVFDETSDTLSLYDTMVRPIVWGIVQGKHGTVFCYGQTGSGKTFTMQGIDQNVHAVDGVLQLALKDIFTWIDKSTAVVHISYLEVYNERVSDLLSGVVGDENCDESMSSNLTVRSDPKRGVTVNGRQVPVSNATTALDLLQFGNFHRQVAATDMNARSSRSHGIFRVTVETRAADGTIRLATLNMVDLAGSENSYTSGTTNRRQQEGGKINQSLLSLSRVINALSMPAAKRPKYISYRDSKLTFLLQPHLSGNAAMAVICCVSPSAVFIEETRSTLRFASRARLIETKATINAVSKDDSVMIRTLNEELATTRQALVAMEQRSALYQEASAEAALELKRLKQLIFGDSEYKLDSLGDGQERKLRIKSEKIKTERNGLVTSNDSIESIHQNRSSMGSYHRVTERRESALSSKSQLINPTLPSEVLVLSLQATQPNENRVSSKTATAVIPSDMEQRATFLEQRLQTTEDLVEFLRKNLMSARKAIHHLVHKNVALASKVDRYHRKIHQLESDDNETTRQQYLLLKYSIYASIFFYFFRFQGLFIVMVMFVWLSLESYTVDHTL